MFRNLLLEVKNKSITILIEFKMHPSKMKLSTDLSHVIQAEILLHFITGMNEIGNEIVLCDASVCPDKCCLFTFLLPDSLQLYCLM